MALHKDLTGADLHEPKGISTATAGQVYEADGAGSGTWTTLVIPEGTFIVTVTTFTANGTWTKPSNIFMAKVTSIGGGGGGWTLSGTAGNGGNTTFGAFHTAGGGGNGSSGSGGEGGTATGGDLNFAGRAGDAGTNPKMAGIYLSQYGLGGTGTNPGGGGGACIEWLTSTELSASSYGVTIGSGGTGSSGGGATAADGICIVEEYISVV